MEGVVGNRKKSSTQTRAQIRPEVRKCWSLSEFFNILFFWQTDRGMHDADPLASSPSLSSVLRLACSSSHQATSVPSFQWVCTMGLSWSESIDAG